MSNTSNTTAPTQFIQTNLEKYAYRRIGKGNGLPLLCLQHFTGTLDNWDPAVIDPLGLGREVILFESAGLGRSTGKVPENMAGMAAHGSGGFGPAWRRIRRASRMPSSVKGFLRLIHSMWASLSATVTLTNSLSVTPSSAANFSACTRTELMR